MKNAQQIAGQEGDVVALDTGVDHFDFLSSTVLPFTPTRPVRPACLYGEMEDIENKREVTLR